MINLHKPYGPYERFFKRPMDILLSLIALIVLSPLLLILTVVGAVAMKGNPFFTQERPGKDERIFKLIKLRTMTNKKNAAGQFLPDEQRLTRYGGFLRKTSLDELPELINILKGDMSVVGPRPLRVKYLSRYNDVQHRRHEILPGLTGLAQVNGRNGITWQKKFEYDVDYVEHITFCGDVKLIFSTVFSVLKSGGDGSGIDVSEEFLGNDVEDSVEKVEV